MADLTTRIGLFTIGACICATGLFMHGDHLKAFRENPRLTLRLRYWANVVLDENGTGYFAIFLLACGAIFVAGGVTTVVAVFLY